VTAPPRGEAEAEAEAEAEGEREGEGEGQSITRQKPQYLKAILYIMVCGGLR
jgi:hypothetical protein